ncbi:TRAP transporter substrate-binding protein [Salipaludibacillus sp. CF4.18]|uniref:TRAP transporter substrate-binding protein n=1 Tax=Salipaludibacillus sp. CF4.18 TaxID=3373081 RepID=UPI003EE630B2
MKKLTLNSMLMVTLLFLGACGDTNDSSGAETSNNTEINEINDSAESNEENNTAVEASVEGLEFSLGHMNSTDHVQDSLAMRPWTEQVAEATDGRVQFQIYPGGALGSPPETYDNIVTGIMDAGWGLQGYNAGVWEIHSAMHLPFLAEGTAADLSVVTQKLYDTFPEIQEEYGDVKVLWTHAADPYAIITAGTKVETLEDLEGLRLRTPHVEGGEMIESWGGTPVSMPAPEIYDAMQRGVIDGGVLPVAAIADFNIYDVVDYVTIGNFNTSLFYVFMNQSSWDSISAEDQKIIEELSGEQMALQSGEAFDTQREDAYNKSIEEGIEFYELEEAELARFKEASEVVTERWLGDMEDKGVDGQAIIDEALKLMEE